jgi:nucleoside-diphosphate-sugar epimerase
LVEKGDGSIFVPAEQLDSGHWFRLGIRKIGNWEDVSDGQFHAMNEIISAICKVLGRTPPRMSLPVGPVCLTVGALEGAGRMIGFKSPVGRATIDKYTEDIAVSSQRIQNELGFKPQFDLRSGWQKTVEEMRFTKK